MTEKFANAYISLCFEMAREGWVYGAPSFEVEDSDRGIVEDLLGGMKCPDCGARLQYHPWHKKKPRQYMAVTLCGECGRRGEL